MYMAVIAATIVSLLMLKAVTVLNEKDGYSITVALFAGILVSIAIDVPNGRYVNAILSGFIGTFIAVYIQEMLIKRK